MTLDEARERYPDLGFALYALVPGEDLTMEVVTADGTIFTFNGPSEAAVMDSAFPAPIPTENAFD